MCPKIKCGVGVSILAFLLPQDQEMQTPGDAARTEAV